MASAKDMKPFNQLRHMERLGRDHRADLPTQVEHRDQWDGIGFRLLGKRFVAPMGEVTEILTYPDMSRIPRTKDWVRGVANVRGTLLPVMDLAAYLGRRATSVTRLSRVLVVDRNGVHAGLLVDEVLGMRHFFTDDYQDAPADLDEVFDGYVTGSFLTDGMVWSVFSMAALVDNPQFMKVAS